MPVQVRIFAGEDCSEEKINQWLSEVSQDAEFRLERTHLEAASRGDSRGRVLMVFYSVEKLVSEHACPTCGGKMLKRFRRWDNQPFWGCENFPDCRGVVNMDGSVGRNRKDEDGNIPF